MAGEYVFRFHTILFAFALKAVVWKKSFLSFLIILGIGPKLQ